MTKKKQFIDPSLARGLAKSAVRSAVQRDDEFFQRVNTDKATGVLPKGRAAAFRHGVDLMRRRALGALILDRPIGGSAGKKRDQHLLAIWDALDTKDGLALGMMWFIARDFSVVDYAPLLVSGHACERIFERLGSTNLLDLEQELRSSTMLVIRLWAAMTRSDVERVLRDRGVAIPTRNGAVFVRRDEEMIAKPHLIATTWVSNDELFPDQFQDLDALKNGILQWRDKAGQVVGQIEIAEPNWPEITAQMETYGRIQGMRY